MTYFDYCCVFGCGNFPIQGTNICESHYRLYRQHGVASGISQVSVQLQPPISNIHISGQSISQQDLPPNVGGIGVQS